MFGRVHSESFYSYPPSLQWNSVSPSGYKVRATYTYVQQAKVLCSQATSSITCGLELRYRPYLLVYMYDSMSNIRLAFRCWVVRRKTGRKTQKIISNKKIKKTSHLFIFILVGREKKKHVMSTTQHEHGYELRGTGIS